ncbi:hypothetical protein CLG96_05920 [Sphingomonas oleivorans]|uniref:RiboL-PSP-HEPN domain-containing protein n=2 Tax=Sphingomonas oleivorans TaxID=1735121 RepID=A0A2T5FZG9_9SPHN|nr:hypothetical protein CLG96_05920 [Sphingomonas oleivorans]
MFIAIEPDKVVKSAIDAIVNRRNQIAHGKVDATVTLGDAEIYVDRVERVAVVFDIIVTNELNTRTKVTDCWSEMNK